MAGVFDHSFIYVAQLPGSVKIGVTTNPASREKTLGSKARIVKVWRHAYPPAIELMCVDAWNGKERHCRERFLKATTAEAIALVERMIRAYRRGKRPGTHAQRAAAKRHAASVERYAGVARAKERGVKFGQPSKWTPEMIKKVEAGIRAGKRVAEVALDVGLAEATIRLRYNASALEQLRAKGKR